MPKPVRKLKALRCKACHIGKLQPVETNAIYTRNLDYCDSCLDRLEKELINLRESGERQIQSIELYELDTFAQDTLDEFNSILRSYQIKDSTELEEILSNS